MVKSYEQTIARSTAPQWKEIWLKKAGGGEE